MARFEDHSASLLPGFAVPPAEPLHVAEFLPATGSYWIGAPTIWGGGEPHPTPRRQIFVTIKGEYEVTAGDGATRSFPVGTVLLMEDVGGIGHSTRITSMEDVMIFAVALRSDEAC